MPTRACSAGTRAWPSPSPPGFLGPSFPLTRWQAWVGCGFALITLILLANLVHSRVGRSWRALRDDEVAASLAGLNVARLQILAFVVSSACAGLGGALLAMWALAHHPATFTLTLSIALLTAAVLGGLGSLAGAIWGSLVLVLVPGYLTNWRTSHGLSSGASCQRPDRRLRRRADRRHARIPSRNPGRHPPPVRASPRPPRSPL